MTGNKERKFEPCKFGNLSEILYKNDLDCHSFLQIQEINITSFNKNKINKAISLKSPKIIEYKTDYLEFVRFLEKDIIKSKFDFRKELGNLLSVCAKYKCKIVLSSEILNVEEACDGCFVPDNPDGYKYILIRITENIQGYLVDYKSTKDVLRTLRHEIFHLLQYIFGFTVLAIDIFDQSAREVFNRGYQTSSIDQLIAEFEAFSADKVPFMNCEIESHLSEFSSIKGSKYAATPQRLETIQLIARERRIPIYTEQDKSISLEEKEIEKIFNEELKNL